MSSRSRHRMRPRPSGPRRPKLSWDTYQRQVLCCLYRFFECSNSQVSAIFSKIFRNHLLQCGYGEMDVPRRTLDAQWSWLRRQKRPVWYHVHVGTEFSTEKEWKEIVRLIRITAFDLGLPVREKRQDAIVIPDGEFDMSEKSSEFLASVLLTSPAHQTQALGMASASVGASAEVLVDESIGAAGDICEETYATSPAECAEDSPIASMPLAEATSGDSLWSKFSCLTDTPTTEVAQTLSEGSMGENRRITHCRASPVVSRVRLLNRLLESPIASSPNQDFEPLVNSHGKVCFWCFIEGKNVHECESNPEPEVSVTQPTETQGWQPIDMSAIQSIELATAEAATRDMDDLVLGYPEHIPRLPGHCGVEGAPPLPPLLYRWYNGNSQGVNEEDLLVAGCFVGSYPNIILPSKVSATHFHDMFKAHVTREKVSTPFISAFARPLTPVHRAIRNRAGAKVAVIDPRRIPMPVFHAQPLAQTTQTTVPRWKGYGEFEIWGCIPGDALIATFQITTLEEIAAHDHEIEQFLQLPLMQSQETCHRGLRRDLRMKLPSLSYEDNRPVLCRLARQLDIPEKYHEDFANDVHKAWTLDLGGSSRGWEDLDDGEPGVDESASVQTPVESHEACPLNQEIEQKIARGVSESTRSYIPPESDGGSPSTSTSEDEDDLSESPEAPCPRRDTPSPAVSISSDTDTSLEARYRSAKRRRRATDMYFSEPAVLATPLTTSRYFRVSHKGKPTVPLPNFSTLSLSKDRIDDFDSTGEAEWPSSADEALEEIDTPTKFRFDDHVRSKGKGKEQQPLQNRSNSTQYEPIIVLDDEVTEI